jgi:hypothetical protein
LVIDQFPAFEDDGYTKISGLQPSDFTTTVWADAVVQATPVSISEIGSSGEYKLSYTPPTEGYWKLEIYFNFNDEIMVSEAEVRVPESVDIMEQLALIKDGGTGLFVPSDSLHMQSEDLSRILGLLHYNAIVDNQTYDANSQLTTARLRVFDSRAHVPGTPGGSETLGLKHQYDIDAEYDGLGIVKLYRLRRVL